MKHSDYKIGWISALPLELSAAEAMLDEVHEPLPRLPYDDNVYSFGKIGKHNVVMACLPAGEPGTVSAAKVAKQLRNSFPSVNAGLLVGIGGAVPSTERDLQLGKAIEHDIRLGDIVISQPFGDSGGVIQWDFGKTVQGGRFMRTGSLNSPPDLLLSALSSLQAQHRIGARHLDSIASEMLKKYPDRRQTCSYQGKENDQLFEAEYDHPVSESTCVNCDRTKTITRPQRDSLPVLHYGIIASGNQVMRHGCTREKLGKDLGALCFEMEAAGLMNNYPCLVVRGIADYADSHKNKRWQDYAATVAAAYAKELLSILPGEQTFELPEIRQLTLETQSSSPIYLTTLPVTRPWFFGRSKELSEMTRILDPQKPEQKCIVLCSVGGVGKTKLALRYLEIKGASYDLVLWINMSTQINIQLSFSEVASSIDGLNVASRSSCGPARDSSKSDVTFVKSWLEKAPKTWLMVLDSLDDIEHHDAWALLPKCNSGSILVTSTRMDFAKSWAAEILEVSGLDHEAGAHLLLHQLSETTRAHIALDEAKSVVDQLSGNPLAIEQASALLSSGFSVDEFRKYYSSRYKEVMSKKPSASAWSYDKNKSVFETFETLHEVLAQTDANIVNLLSLVSFFGTSEIPVAIFQNLEPISASENSLSFSEENLAQGKEAWFYEKFNWLKAWCSDDYFIRITINQLENCCLVKTRKTVKGSLQSITVHNAISRWGRERQVSKEAASWCLLASYVLSRFLKNLAPEKRRGAPSRIISTHVHFSFSCISQYVYRDLIAPSRGKFRDFYAFICDQFAAHFHEFGQLLEEKKSLVDLIDYCKIQQSKQWPVDKPSLETVVRLRDNCWESGDWANAQKLNSELLALPATISGKFDDIVVDANAKGHQIRDKLDRARAAAERASRREMPKTLPYEPPEVNAHSTSTNTEDNAVIGLDENSQNELYALNETLSQMEEEFGHNDRFTLEAHLNLAQFYESHEKYPEAMNHIKKIVLKADKEGVHKAIRICEAFQETMTPAWFLALHIVECTEPDNVPIDLRLALAYAAVMNEENLAAILLSSGISADSEFVRLSMSALQLTIIRNSKQVFDLLLYYGANCDAKDDRGNAVLGLAASMGREEMVEPLLDHGASIDMANIDGFRALHSAARTGGIPVMRILLRRGAALDHPTYGGDTPLMYAIYSRVAACERVRFLIDQGADFEHKNNVNRNALQLAAVCMQREVFELIARQAKDIRSKDETGTTPLHKAAFLGWISAIRILIDRKVDINSEDNLGRTPLHYAVLGNHLDEIGLLLKHGAKARGKSYSGYSPEAALRDVLKIVTATETREVMANLGINIDIETLDVEEAGQPFIGPMFGSEQNTMRQVSTEQTAVRSVGYFIESMPGSKQNTMLQVSTEQPAVKNVGGESESKSKSRLRKVFSSRTYKGKQRSK